MISFLFSFLKLSHFHIFNLQYILESVVPNIKKKITLRFFSLNFIQHLRNFLIYFYRNAEKWICCCTTDGATSNNKEVSFFLFPRCHRSFIQWPTTRYGIILSILKQMIYQLCGKESQVVHCVCLNCVVEINSSE